MKNLILIIIALAIAVFIGLEIRTDPGYAMLAYRDWTMEMPLWLALLLWLIIFVAFYYIIRLLFYVFSFHGRVRTWSGKRGVRKSHNRTSQGLVELMEGHYDSAVKVLVSSARKSTIPLIPLLLAARGYQELKDYEHRDKCLRMAYKKNSSAKIAVLMTQAELQYNHGQFEQALATLQEIAEIKPKHPTVLKMMLKVYVKVKDWDKLLTILPKVRKAKNMDNEQLDEIERNVYFELLKNSSHDIAKLKEVWKHMPKSFHKNPEVINIYVKALLEADAQAEAEDILFHAIKQQWEQSWVEFYGRVTGKDPHKQLQHAEGWLKAHPEDPTLLLTLGRLSRHCKLWGKARTYLESSIAIRPTSAAHIELAQLVDQFQESENALRHYRKAWELEEKGAS